jgi:hypothetical protein
MILVFMVPLLLPLPNGLICVENEGCIIIIIYYYILLYNIIYYCIYIILCHIIMPHYF